MATVALTPLVAADPSGGSATWLNPAGSAFTTADTITFPNGGRTLLVMRNTGSAGTCVAVTSQAVKGLTVADVTGITLAAAATNGGVNIIGPFDPTLYNDASGLVNITTIATAAGQCYAITVP